MKDKLQNTLIGAFVLALVIFLALAGLIACFTRGELIIAPHVVITVFLTWFILLCVTMAMTDDLDK